MATHIYFLFSLTATQYTEAGLKKPGVTGAKVVRDDLLMSVYML